ncbi:MAG TPA: sigma-54 dependent transcriptional regulator [Longimicrobiales bacterium]|nr:sigma-54 dependent transcriptional regulator [Longimicrobiales bacterium]
MAASILIVDDEPNIRRMLGSLLRHEGYSVTEAANGAEARERLNDTEADVTLLDLAIPDITGFELLEAIHHRWPLTPVIMMSGRASLSDAVQATKLGAFHFIEKPLTPEAVLLTIRGALDLRRARTLSREIAREYGPGDELIGDSNVMQQIRQLVGRIAPTDARVLITGESGTGKELVAAALHARSPRSDASFVRLNSAAIPRELIESELFGHERGAFSGAHALHRGKFELADGGTLFLDEVGDLSSDAQAKLLRVIETGEVERVGAERALKVDVRVIAATNKNLSHAIDEGRFREDLFHRLNVIPIEVPPLRTRREDMPALVGHFMQKWQARTGRLAPSVSSDAIAALQAYDWPGNVRELANLCERMAILSESNTVDAQSVARVMPVAAAGHDLPLHDQLDKHERNLIESALTRAEGNIADAAKLLKTDRANLYRRMRRLGIER